MDQGIRKFMERLQPNYAHNLPVFIANEQHNGNTGISYLFALSSQMLTLINGALAIVSIEELEPSGDWNGSEFSLQVAAFVKMAVETAAAVECLLSTMLAKIQCRRESMKNPLELGSIDEILTIGGIYIHLLNKVTLATNLAAIQQGLIVPGQRPTDAKPIRLGDEMQPIRESMQKLTAQAVELELRVEMFEKIFL